MRLDALLEMGAAERLAAERVEAERKAAAEEGRREVLAEADWALREWLGELVEDLEMEGPRHDSFKYPEWWVRPRSWKLKDMALVVRCIDGNYEWRMAANGQRLLESRFIKDYVGMASFLLDAQRAHDRNLELTIASRAKHLATPRDPGCSDDAGRLWETHLELAKLAPGRLAEWDLLLAQSLESLEAERSEEAEKVALRAAAVERYEEALEAWAAESDATRTHNEAVARRLREKLGDVSMQVCEVEYAVVVREDGETALETRRVWSVANTASAPATFYINEGGRVRAWTLSHVVRVSEMVTVTPDTHSWLFPQAVIGDEWVYFIPGLLSHQEAVDAALAEARELPEPPDWDEYGRGLYWGMDVDAAVRRATHDQADDKDEIEF